MTHPFCKFLLFAQAYLNLVLLHRYIRRGDFAALYRAVRELPVGNWSQINPDLEAICHAVDLACVLYWTDVRCLQRSAATVQLLKKYGIPAVLVIGVQQLPLKSHAWAEVQGRIVNDKPYVSDIYTVLDRC